MLVYLQSSEKRHQNTYSRLLNNRASTEHVFRQFSTKHALITELHDYTFLSRGGKKIYIILFQRKLFTKKHLQNQ